MIFEFILSIHNHLTSWRVFMGTSHIPGCESLKKKLINLYIFFKYKIKEIWQVYTIKNCRPQTRSSKTCLAYFSIFEFLPRAGLNTAWVRHPVFQRVGPGRRSCRHRRVVVESVPAQHIEHFIPSDCQERCSHPLDIYRVNPGKPNQELGLSNHLVGPLLLVEVCTEGVSDCM